MYNGIKKIEKTLEEIEKNITSEIDCEALASNMNLSVYEFRRIFAFVVGCPLSEYVRKRRLTLSACEIAKGCNQNMQQISEKYGYSTLASFSKAFSEYHGFPPSACKKGECEPKIFLIPKFEIRIQNEEEKAFRITLDEGFSIRGYKAYSEISDTCCCENVWTDFYALGKDKTINSDNIYVSYKNDKGMVNCCIGERDIFVEDTENTEKIPSCRWLCVKMNTTDDDVVNQKYNDIFYKLLPSTNLIRRIDVPTVEVFPRDMSEKNFDWEIRIPIE